jgi:hypothetical protein
VKVKNARTIWITALVLFLCDYPSLGTIHFRDGLTHNINYKINDIVCVDYQTPLMYTTVNMLNGGKISPYLYGYGNSNINISGGCIEGCYDYFEGNVFWINGSFRCYDSSRVNISGGEIEELCCFNSSQVNMSGGKIIKKYVIEYFEGEEIGWWLGGDLYSFDSSQINISGGSIDTVLYSLNTSYVNISGGEIYGTLYGLDSSYVNISGGETYNLGIGGSSQADISGGEIGSFGAYDTSHVNISGGLIGLIDNYNGTGGSSQVNISGGTINGFFFACDSSYVNISGGVIDCNIVTFYPSQVDILGGTVGGDLMLFDQSMIKIFGYDFTVDDQPVGYGELTSITGGNPWVGEPMEPTRHLAGSLLNGGFIDSDFRIGHDARIVLIPEPASALILGLGSLFFTLRRRRRS